jgi:hypothetical protein
MLHSYFDAFNTVKEDPRRCGSWIRFVLGSQVQKKKIKMMDTSLLVLTMAAWCKETKAGLVWHTARPAPDQPPPQENSTDKFYNHKVENKRRVLNFEHLLHHFAVNNSPFGVETTTLLVKAQARFDDFDDFDLPVCTQESSSWPLMTQGAAE